MTKEKLIRLIEAEIREGQQNLDRKASWRPSRGTTENYLGLLHYALQAIKDEPLTALSRRDYK